MPDPAFLNPTERPPIELQEDLRVALRGGSPGGVTDEATLSGLFRRYECGGWLHARRAGAGAPPLDGPWRAAAAKAHRKTLVDSLAALGVLGEVAGHLGAAGIPIIVLKGAAYLDDLYDDPGERVLTDVDILIRPADAAGAAERLGAAGFAILTSILSGDARETRRFEMARPGPAPVAVEIHWRLGSRGRVHFDQEGLWERSRPVTIQGAACRTLGREDALVYHAWHAADSYYGPTLKWAIDFHAMLSRWKPDPESLLAAATTAGARVALHLLLRQVEALFPGSTPPGLVGRSRPGVVRRLALGRWLLGEPLEFLRDARRRHSRPLLRPLLIDAPSDALAAGLAVIGRPWNRGGAPPPERPWEAALPGGAGPERASSVD